MRICRDICFWFVLVFVGSRAMEAIVIVDLHVDEGDPGSVSTSNARPLFCPFVHLQRVVMGSESVS